MVLGVLAAFILLFFKPVVAGDGFGYYVILEGAVRYQTLNLSEQLHYNDITFGPTVWLHPMTQKYVSQYAPGLPLLSAPIYAFSLVLDDVSVFHLKDAFFLEERGDIVIHMASVPLTSLVLLGLGMIAILRMMHHLGMEKEGAFALLLTFFGSPITRYATYDLSYTHVAEAGILALALYYFFKNEAWKTGAFLGLMTLVRYTSLAFAVPLTVYYFWKGRRQEAMTMIASMVPFIAFAMLWSWVQFGSPLATGYSQASNLADNMDWPVHMPRVLFSLEGNPPGLLWWSPLLFASFAGLWVWKDDRKWVLMGLAVMLLLVTGSFFKGTTGFSFSNRYFVSLLPVFVVGSAVMLKNKQGRWMGMLALYGLVLFLLTLSNDWGHFPTITEVWSHWFTEGHLAEFPQAIIDKLGFVRFLTGK